LHTPPPAPGERHSTRGPGLCGVAVIEAEGAAETLLPMHDSLTFPLFRVRDNQPIAESLMISLRMVMREVFAYRGSQGVFAKEDHSVQTVFLVRLDESLGESVQVW
jgi:hypothetical protein